MAHVTLFGDNGGSIYFLAYRELLAPLGTVCLPSGRLWGRYVMPTRPSNGNGELN